MRRRFAFSSRSPSVTFLTALFFSFCYLTPIPAKAALPTQIAIGDLIPEGALYQLVKVFGNLTEHRAFQGAESLGTSYWDLGIEAALVHLPDDFSDNLTKAGFTPGSTPPPSLPMPKLHFNKGISPQTDLGISGLYLDGTMIVGLHLKRILSQPEEGMVWALRGSYSNTQIKLDEVGADALPITINGVELGAGTLDFGFDSLSLELLGSRRLQSAEPYLGAGFHRISGQVSARIKLDVLPDSQELSTPAYNYYNFTFFTGVIFRSQPLGLSFAIETGASSLLMHYMGAVLSFHI